MAPVQSVESVQKLEIIPDSEVTLNQERFAKKAVSAYRMVTEELPIQEIPTEYLYLLNKLQRRFEQNMRRHPRISWANVQKRLSNSDLKKLWSLSEMERTGGEPDVVDYDEGTGKYIFMDCSIESPLGRRNCVYDRQAENVLGKASSESKCSGNAEDMAAQMGIKLLTEKEYEKLLTKGEFDKNSWSWIYTPIERRRPADNTKRGIALVGDWFGEARVVEEDPTFFTERRGFRGSLRV